MKIESMQREHAPVAAELHYEGQRHTFLGRMGLPFLTTLYQELTASPWGFGLVAISDGQVVGTATATRNTRALFQDLIFKRGWHLILPTLGALIRDPSLIRYALETLSYPSKIGDVTQGEFEFLFLGVHQDRRGQGLGGQLTRALIDECRHQGCRVFDSLVENENEISTRIHHRLGFQEKKTIMLYGRPMTIYSLPLTDEAPEGESSP